MGTVHIEFSLPQRAFGFDIGYDPANIPDVSTKACIDQFGCCEPEVVHMMARVLREGDLAIDVGANIGFFTLVMAQLVGNTGQVLAFEPGTNNLHKLHENVALNRFDNVVIHRTALWSEPGERDLHLCQDGGLDSLFADAGAIGKARVRVEVLDAYCPVRAPRLIKLDVEGAEEHALRGASGVLERGVDFIACELNQSALARGDCSQRSLRQFMYENGYQMFFLHSDGIVPTLIPPATTVVTGRKNLNVLFSTVTDVGLAWPTVEVKD